MQKKYSVLILIVVLSLALSGCVKFSGGGAGGGGVDGGIFISTTAGKTWAQSVAIPAIGGQLLSMANANIKRMVIDSQDRLALYAVTENEGLVYSYDGGMSWNRVKDFAVGNVNDVAISYGDKCTSYLAQANRVYKSEDCMRTWKESYFDTRQDAQYVDIETEWYNKQNVYAANNYGEVLKSVDYGKSWKTVKRINNPIVKLFIDKNDTRKIFVGTQVAGLYKTMDGGNTWTDENPEKDINLGLNAFPGAAVFIDIAQDPNHDDNYIVATQYGLLRTKDGGASWEDIKLITPPGAALISSLAIDPKNGNNIYYGTDTTFYKSVDNGVSWVPQKLPTTRKSSFLMVDPEDSNIIYLGTWFVKK